MKNLLLFTSLFASLFVIVNCSPNKSSSVNDAANASALGACPAGYYYTNGQCYTGNGSSTPAGFNYNNGFYADNYSGFGSSIQINGAAGITLMKQLYKLGMGVCDRASNTYGQANCDYYIQGNTDIIIQFPSGGSTTPTAAIVTIFAKPKQNPYYNYQASFGSWWQVAGAFLGVYIPDTNYYSGAYRNPLQIQTAVSPVTNNNVVGFSASGYGDAWTGYNNTLVTIEVLSGNVNSDNTLNYNLKIGGQVAATGRMNRCQTFNCGI